MQKNMPTTAEARRQYIREETRRIVQAIAENREHRLALEASIHESQQRTAQRPAAPPGETAEQ